jgi:hypothetical protein
MATSTGDVLGTRLHEAATDGIEMYAETTEESLFYWKRIANAMIDFFADMGGGNPIIFKCGDSKLTITNTGILGQKGTSELSVDSAGIKGRKDTSEFTIDGTEIAEEAGGSKLAVDSSGIKGTGPATNFN